MFVTLADSPEEKLATWSAHDGGVEPGEVAFVAAGDLMRSTAAESASVDFPDPRTTIGTISISGDLNGLGIQTSEFFSDWEGGDPPIAVCVHFLSTLLQYVKTRQVVRFLHVLTGRVDAVDAR